MRVWKVKMPEKKHSRISVRIPDSWKRRPEWQELDVSWICRTALFTELQRPSKDRQNVVHLHSKQQAAVFFNQLSGFIVRTKPEGFDLEINTKGFKTPYFREVFLPRAQPEELVIMGDFLGQGEFAEEILQEAYDGL